jgi:class 3 adenylate cyclase
MAASSRSAPVDDILARHGPADARGHLRVPPDGPQYTLRRVWLSKEGEKALGDLTSNGSTPVNAAVVVGDLRMSALLLKEAVSPSLYARYLIGFTEAVRSLANGFSGWFDKFTGDGFIAFWIYQDEGQIVDTLPGFCQSILPAAQTLIANLKKNSRNFPVGVGLSIGIDSGACELVRVGDALTILGNPIVGATRMVSGARAGQALVNVGLGATLEAHKDRLEAVGARLEKRVVPTKEYPTGQEAYELEFSTAADATARIQDAS